MIVVFSCALNAQPPSEVDLGQNNRIQIVNADRLLKGKIALLKSLLETFNWFIRM